MSAIHRKRFRRTYWLVLALVLSIVAGCSETEPTATETTVPSATPTSTPPVAVVTPTPTVVTRLEGESAAYWWNDVVFYEIFVRSFYDSDGDGIGDLNGLIAKLDYLNDGDPSTTDDLGVGGIWLMPIAESPSYHGYDVVDYFSVEQDYGTQEDFHRLVEEAHKRGIRVIIDLVLNHTSSKHPWFLSARDDKNSPYREYYIWADEYPGYMNPWGGAAWHRSGYSYYYGVFWDGMPDLNYTNPAVTAEMRGVIRFWLDDMGADGYRLDGIKHLIEDGPVQENTPATHEWLREFHTFYKGVKPDALAVGEVWSSTEEVVRYIGDQIDLAFEFDTAQAMLESARLENRDPILRAHRSVNAQYPRNQFAPFLTNHDQERAMSQLRGEVGHAQTAASLLLTGPGVPFLYYGEEIGHSGGKPDENIRTPMQWSGEDVAGFTSAAGAWKAPQRDYLEVNVASQTDDPNSLLSHYRRLIHARNQHEALRIGDWQEVQVQNEHVYAFLRHSKEETMLVLINLSGEPISEYSLDLNRGPLSEGEAGEVLAGVAVDPPAINANGGFDAYVPVAELAPHGTYIIQLR